MREQLKKIFRNIGKKKKAELRRKLKHEAMSKYKVVSTVVFEKQWSDVPTEYIPIVFKQNGYGVRKMDFDYKWPEKVLLSEWYAKEVVPWLNNIQKSQEVILKKKSNVVKLEIVKKQTK